MPGAAAARESAADCGPVSVSGMEAQTARLIKENHRLDAWVAADTAGRCYGMLALSHRERRHYEDLYRAGLFCLIAYGTGRDEPALAASEDGSLLLENDLIYSAGVLQSIGDDGNAPPDIRSNARSLVSRLIEAIKPAAKP
ncbi:MAG: hypothetical protein GIX02_00180 [Candidatus Eremiobacteraeota bacterium]|nr:hypothetical protein [Candidatus Eremiobacteraeota bacterium]